MAVARPTVRGLSSGELQVIREALAAGRRPKVQFTETAGQIAGQVGQVVSLTDPAVSDDWVVVRFGRDELPFSPADLRVAPKVPAKRAAAEPVPVRPEPEFVIDKPPSTVAASPGPVVAGPVVAAAATGDRSPVAPVSGGSVSGGSVSGGAGRDDRVADDGAADAGRPARKAAARKPTGPKAPPGLTVTLGYAEGEWTVAAMQGAKCLAKPYVIRPVEALRMVSLIDVPGVQEAVEQIMSVERAEAERQAERLRAELAEIEARLAELRDAG